MGLRIKKIGGARFKIWLGRRIGGAKFRIGLEGKIEGLEFKIRFFIETREGARQKGIKERKNTAKKSKVKAVSRVFIRKVIGIWFIELKLKFG